MTEERTAAEELSQWLRDKEYSLPPEGTVWSPCGCWNNKGD